jgi:hypothetical protein
MGRLADFFDIKPGYHWSRKCDAWMPGSVWDMAIDPNANAAYFAAKNVQFAVGQAVWLSGIEFTVVQVVTASPAVPTGQLILQPTTSKV